MGFTSPSAGRDFFGLYFCQVLLLTILQILTDLSGFQIEISVDIQIVVVVLGADICTKDLVEIEHNLQIKIETTSILNHSFVKRNIFFRETVGAGEVCQVAASQYFALQMV